MGRYISQHHNRKKMILDVNNTYFNFDKVGLDKMKNMPVKMVNVELHKMAKSFVKIGRINSKNFTFPNILVACDNKNDVNYCEKSRLIVEKKKLDEILEIISHDIVNPSKWKWIFSSIFVDKFVNYFKFIRRKNETITIQVLN